MCEGEGQKMEMGVCCNGAKGPNIEMGGGCYAAQGPNIEMGVCCRRETVPHIEMGWLHKKRDYGFLTLKRRCILHVSPFF